jgi:hypothetical protein
VDVGVASGSDSAASINAVKGPHYLDFDGALAKLRELGFSLTKSQLRWRIRSNDLPFFKDGHKLYISENALVMHFHRRQLEAEKETRGSERDKNRLG